MGLPASAIQEFQNKYSSGVNDFFPHSVTIRAGDKVKFQPFCMIHPFMHGRVVVQ